MLFQVTADGGEPPLATGIERAMRPHNPEERGPGDLRR